MVRRGKITTQSCQLDTPQGEIVYLLKRSTARRTMTIAVNSRAEVSVSVPLRLQDEQIHRFIHDKADWILGKFSQVKAQAVVLAKRRYDHAHEFLFLGNKYPLFIQEHNIKRAQIEFDGQKWTITLPSNYSAEDREKMVKAKLVSWYRAQAEEILGARLFHYARIMGLTPRSVFIRTQKRLWGCCDFNKQSINLNWQIILSPQAVIDYVIVHELAHLVVPNHSQRFWKKVERFMPDYKVRKQWLKVNHFDMMLP